MPHMSDIDGAAQQASMKSAGHIDTVPLNHIALNLIVLNPDDLKTLQTFLNDLTCQGMDFMVNCTKYILL